MDTHDSASLQIPPLLEPAPTFTASWSPSKASSLDTTTLPILKVPRAWERAPKSPQAEQSRVKKVWKRYGLRSQPEVTAPSSQPELVQETDEGIAAVVGKKSPLKIVKRLRVRSPRKSGEIVLGAIEGETVEKNYRSTRWDRRSSGLSHKNKPMLPPGGDEAAQRLEAPISFDEIEPTDEAAEDIPIAPGQETSGCEEQSGLREQLEPVNLDKATAEHTASAPQDILNIPEDLTAFASDSPILPESPPVTSDSPTIEERIQSDLAEEQANEEAAAEESFMIEAQSASENNSSADSETRAAITTIPVTYPAFAFAEELVSTEGNKENIAESFQDSSLLLALSPSKLVEKFTVDRSSDSPQQRKSSRDDVADDIVTEEPILASPTLNLNFSTAPRSQKTQATGQIQDVSYPVLASSSSSRSSEPDQEEADSEEEDSRNSPDELSLEDEDQTFTLNVDATTTLLEDESKAFLRNFIHRTAASKASKSTVTAPMARRESLQNRRDSGAVRHALASPRVVLEEKDVNLSPRSIEPVTQSLNGMLYAQSPLAKRSAQEVGLDNPLSLAASTRDEGEDELTLTLDLGDLTNGSPRRRSSRTRSSKLPSLPTIAAQLMGPPKIPVRTDGGERVLLNRTEAQQLADLVRKNTKKNKSGAVPAPQRLTALKTDALLEVTAGSASPHANIEPTEGERKLGKNGRLGKSLRWREVLVEFSTSAATADLDEVAEIMNTQIRGSLDAEEPKKAATPRLRRLKGLGGANGTPARQLLSSSLLLDKVEEERTASSTKPSKKATTAQSTPAQQDDSATSAVKKDAPAKKEKKSKIQPPSTSTPTNKKLLLNPSLTSLSGLPVLAGKENTSQLLSPAKKLSGRGKIPLPSNSLATPVKRAGSRNRKL